MKSIAVIVVGVLIVGFCVPPSMALVRAHDGESAIGLIDVCHSGAPALTSGGDMPCLSEGIRDATPALFCYLQVPGESPAPYYHVSALNEHPPQA